MSPAKYSCFTFFEEKVKNTGRPLVENIQRASRYITAHFQTPAMRWTN